MRTLPTIPLVLAAILSAANVSPLDAAQDREHSPAIERTKERGVEREQTRERTREQRRASQRETQTERVTRTFNIGPDGEIDLSNISGDISITRASGNAATIEIVKNARAESADEARAQLPLVTVDVTERGPRVEIRTRYPRWEDGRREVRRNIHVEVAFTIAAPPNTRIVARSISGNVSVREMSGTVTVESVSGNLRIENGGRAVNGKTISGDVELTDTKVDGALSVGSISGTVRLQRSRVGSLNVSSVSGEVMLDDVDCNRVEAQTISGNLVFRGDLAPNGRYELTSHSGNVRLAIGAKTGFQVEATSFSGGITTDLPLTLQGTEGRGRQRALRGKYGDGSAILDLTSFSGGIVISKR